MLARIQLTSQSPEFSRFVFGTWRILKSNLTTQEINRLLAHCADLGMTTIDTAEIYGAYEAEEAIGKALALSPGLRNRLEIITKAGIYVPCKFHPERKTAHYNASAQRLVKSLEKSLRFLGTERVELFLVHRPDWLTSAEDTAAGLNQLRREGKIAAAGVSNYNVHQFALLNSYVEQPLATNQIEFHLLRMDPMYDGVLDQCQQHRIAPMAWSPLAGGKLFDPALEAAARLGTAAQALAPKYGGATLDQLAYAWLLAHPSRPLPVIGTSKPERIAAAVEAGRITLEREDWYALWEAAQGRRIP